jgi:hypothetical protein
MESVDFATDFWKRIPLRDCSGQSSGLEPLNPPGDFRHNFFPQLHMLHRKFIMIERT